jgi:hypothetical protein
MTLGNMRANGVRSLDVCRCATAGPRQRSEFELSACNLFFVADKAQTKLSALASRASEPLRKLDHGGFD